ncbi:NUDIX domain-containing protein [Paracoccus sp. Z118]|uniref:NUDIX domain-containing protein n=1 Tax=Paracoccus sp. Z118 TaxID=2851017 RepID=UPI001C2C31A2|nr:NUDIX domain-containing protein [Paracoccus sp. Z118]MBV0893212.1 NUDIX domain-containing protein [Paracoccus sp. Z118]
MNDVILIGPMAHPMLREALGLGEGQGFSLPGRLVGGRWAGVRAGEWPVLVAGEGQTPALRVQPTPALARHAAVLGLPSLTIDGQVVFGARRSEGPYSLHVREWPGDWHAELAAAIARHVIAQPPDRSPERIAARLPTIAGWCDSRLRGAQRPAGHEGEPPVRHLAVSEPYAAYFAVEEHRFQHRLHDGGWAAPVDRGVFVSGDAAVVLPWDPVRDRVLVVQQFRAGPAARHDPDPFVLEPVAGRIDAGETPEETMLREAVEEAGVTIDRLIPALHHYPTPGIAAEFIYCYVGIADLPDGCAGIGGLPEEGEDIRGILMDRAELTRLALSGGIVNGPLLILALWLDRCAAGLKAGGPGT